MDSISANQKVGMEMPSRATDMEALSFQVLRLTAAVTPSGTPKPSAKHMLSRATLKV